ncbi:STAS domain-containing protein [Streptomyces sp. NPDC005963]|uniref:STAS domain-containing protein n=1 Tax=Streptomyces sp. NPDC005963 TaxID=3156721 RepID=UPI0033C21137
MTTPRTTFSHRTHFTRSPRTGREVAVMQLAGEVDLDNGAQLDAALRLCLACRPAAILVDLTRVTLMDCAGLSVLHRAHGTATASGTRLALTGRPSPMVDRLLQLTDSGLLRANALCPPACPHQRHGRRPGAHSVAPDPVRSPARFPVRSTGRWSGINRSRIARRTAGDTPPAHASGASAARRPLQPFRPIPAARGQRTIMVAFAATTIVSSFAAALGR